MSLKVFDLQCEHGHVFEGWFASADAYESQKAGGQLSCPMCNSSEVSRKLTASRLNVGRGGKPAASSPSAAELASMQAQLIRHVRQLISETENVGSKFAEESRRIHHGESEDRPIRGTATPQEREELAEEGIAVVAIPDFFDDDRLQ